MKLDFNSAQGLSATLRTLGFEMDVAQLSQGALDGVFHLGCSRQLPVLTVQEVASHYGFQSRNHFARDYRNQFGESPRATLQRASDPGIGLQSVSVAQSPQIAMARR